VPAGCNNFLGGGLVGVVVVHFCFWWWLMVTLAGWLQFEIFFFFVKTLSMLSFRVFSGSYAISSQM
jgi:uncharacterized protein (DUF983 family)